MLTVPSGQRRQVLSWRASGGRLIQGSDSETGSQTGRQLRTGGGQWPDALPPPGHETPLVLQRSLFLVLPVPLGAGLRAVPDCRTPSRLGAGCPRFSLLPNSRE